MRLITFVAMLAALALLATATADPTDVPAAEVKFTFAESYTGGNIAVFETRVPQGGNIEALQVYFVPPPAVDWSTLKRTALGSSNSRTYTVDVHYFSEKYHTSLVQAELRRRGDKGIANVIPVLGVNATILDEGFEEVTVRTGYEGHSSGLPEQGTLILEVPPGGQAERLLDAHVSNGSNLYLQVAFDLKLRNLVVNRAMASLNVKEITRRLAEKLKDVKGAEYVSAAWIASAAATTMTETIGYSFTDVGASEATRKQLRDFIANATKAQAEDSKLTRAHAERMDADIRKGLNLKEEDYQPIVLYWDVHRSFQQNATHSDFKNWWETNRDGIKQKIEAAASAEAKASGSIGVAGGEAKGSMSAAYSRDWYSDMETYYNNIGKWEEAHSEVVTESGGKVEIVGRGLRYVHEAKLEAAFANAAKFLAEEGERKDTSWRVLGVRTVRSGVSPWRLPGFVRGYLRGNQQRVALFADDASPILSVGATRTRGGVLLIQRTSPQSGFQLTFTENSGVGESRGDQGASWELEIVFQVLAKNEGIGVGFTIESVSDLLGAMLESDTQWSAVEKGSNRRVNLRMP